MKRHLSSYLYLALAFLLAFSQACSSDNSLEISGEISQQPMIYPDYIDVTVPCNIAPLNFYISDSVPTAAVFKYGNCTFTVKASGGDIIIPPKRWRQMMGEPQVEVTLCKRQENGWYAYQPFNITVSPDSIDPYLVYRLIPPLYGTWREIGIYQRCLESYDETPLYKNVAYHGNCVNCHSFAARDPERMLLHLRGAGGGTYLRNGDMKVRLDTKTDSTISNFTYPYWHPSGRYVAFSVNDIFQVFHIADPNRTEVIDDDSDIVVYDVLNNRAMSTHLIKAKDMMETFPAFSADGLTLYFCTAAKPDTLPEQFRDVRYSICRVAFDPEHATFGSTVDTIYSYKSTSDVPVMTVTPPASMSVPRPSPDGRWLVTTASDYGQFMIWHKDADLWLCDLDTYCWRPLSRANSDDVDSYHSWSGNSRWLVFSSRRDDGLYSRPYFVHIDASGQESKAFMLPQKRPKKYYEDQENSYNIPEFVTAPVSLDSRQMVEWIDSPSKKVQY